MLEIGKDVWIKTCFGDSINWLVKLVGGKKGVGGVKDDTQVLP